MADTAQEKIAIFVCNDLTGLLVLNRIVPGIKDMGYAPVIFNTGSERNRKFKIPTPPTVAFFNATLLKDTIIPTLEGQPTTDAPNHTFRQLAARHDVEYRDITNVNDPALVNEIAGDPAYRGAIAARFLQVFEKEIISVFHEKGFIWNLHSGLLPQYKGLLTPFRAIANGEKTYGLTLHDLTCGIDEGDIIAKGALPLDTSKPVLDLYLDSVPMGAKLILSALTEFKEKARVQLEPQQTPRTPSYYTNPTAEEYARHMAAGVIYADPAAAIERIAGEFSQPDTLLRSRLKRAMEQAANDATAPAYATAATRRAAYQPQII